MEKLDDITTALNERIGIDRSVVYDFWIEDIDTDKLYGK